MKVLIIQQKMIGDVLTSSILFEAIKKKYPNSELHYLINSHTYAVVENNPFIDQFIFFTPEHEKSKLKLWGLAQFIKKENYTVLIDVYSKLSSNFMSWVSSAKTKISIDKSFNALIYNYRYAYKTSPNTSAGLAIENRLNLLQPLNINPQQIYRPKIYLTPKEVTDAQSFLKTQGLQLDQPIFMISVLGSSPIKTYPYKYLAKLIDLLPTEYPNCQILFNYIPSQKAEAKKIFKSCAPKTQAHIKFEVFGENLRAFLAIATQCKAVIGNEGGSINMAKALKIPSFCIFAPWVKKEAWNMFDDGKNHVSVHYKDFKPEAFEAINSKSQIKIKSEEFYKDFKPKLFQNLFLTFLKRLKVTF